MKGWVFLLILAILIASGLLATLGDGTDTRDFLYWDGYDRTEGVGVLLDGQVEGVDVNDKKYDAVYDEPLMAGEVSAGAHNEVIAFHRGYQMTLVEEVSWTAGRDDILVHFKPELELPLCVWLVGTDRADLLDRARLAVEATDAMWRTERLGIRMGAVEYNEAPTTGVKSVIDFTCTTDGCPDASSLRTKAGFTEGRINVYYVDTVDSGEGPSTGNGVWTGGFTLVLGSGTLSDLLGHEIGHALYLSHVDANPAFSVTNVMHSASDTRSDLTEGQVFRAQMEPCSVLNDGTSCTDDPGGTYGLRPGMPTRACGDFVGTSNQVCPVLEASIWPEGK